MRARIKSKEETECNGGRRAQVEIGVHGARSKKSLRRVADSQGGIHRNSSSGTVDRLSTWDFNEKEKNVGCRAIAACGKKKKNAMVVCQKGVGCSIATGRLGVTTM